MKKSKLLLAGVALVLLVCFSIGSASAYFTDYERVQGVGTIFLAPSTEITEEPPDPQDGRKVVTVSNSSEDMAMYFRAKVFTSLKGWYITGDGWSSGAGDYYYYADPVEPQGAAGPMTVNFELPEDAKDGDEVNIIVVYETIPAVPADTGYQAAVWP
ncbi:MAG: hypothetical protein IKQ10_06745 [Oscillospiraceae bacterium]|nr:hypothetical protein [Oscillospiraceae bacterium]